jgi:hypothetical protein
METSRDLYASVLNSNKILLTMIAKNNAPLLNTKYGNFLHYKYNPFLGDGSQNMTILDIAIVILFNNEPSLRRPPDLLYQTRFNIILFLLKVHYF